MKKVIIKTNNLTELKMKKLIALLVIVAFTATVFAQAQPQKKADEKANKVEAAAKVADKKVDAAKTKAVKKVDAAAKVADKKVDAAKTKADKKVVAQKKTADTKVKTAAKVADKKVDAAKIKADKKVEDTKAAPKN